MLVADVRETSSIVHHSYCNVFVAGVLLDTTPSSDDNMEDSAPLRRIRQASLTRQGV